MSIKFEFCDNLTKITDTLNEDIYFIDNIMQILHGMRNVSGKSGRENQNTYFTFNAPFFFFSENSAIHEIMWKNMIEPDRSQVI